MKTASLPLGNVDPSASKPLTSRVRWYVCGLLFYATTVNYVDRQVLGLLKPTISAQLGWNEADFGWIVFAFQAAYALMLPIAGRLLDWLGTRVGYALAVTVWSLAAISHSWARTAFQFACARFALGFGEAANFPAAIKTTATWFPRSERALAIGIFNSGSNIGALLAPLMVPLVALHFGWRRSFLATGALDVLWIIVWLLTYRSPRQNPRISAEELALIESDTAAATVPIPVLTLLTQRRSWAFVIGKFLTDPVWWFYLYWLPSFLNHRYGLDLTHIGAPLVAVYLAADVGSIGGGWLSGSILRRSGNLNRARKTALLVCALTVLPVAGVMLAHGHLWLTVLLIGMAAAGHQGWSCNLYAMAADAFPSSSVASITGLGGMAGAVGGMAAAPLIGWWLDWSHGAYGPLFFVSGSMYLLALVAIQLVLPVLRAPDSNSPLV